MGWVLSIHMACHNHPCSNLRGSDALYWPLQEPGMHFVKRHTCRQNTCTWTIKAFFRKREGFLMFFCCCLWSCSKSSASGWWRFKRHWIRRLQRIRWGVHRHMGFSEVGPLEKRKVTGSVYSKGMPCPWSHPVSFCFLAVRWLVVFYRLCFPCPDVLPQ